MFTNKKINYIFVSFGDEVLNNSNKNSNKFINKLKSTKFGLNEDENIVSKKFGSNWFGSNWFTNKFVPNWFANRFAFFKRFAKKNVKGLSCEIKDTSVFDLSENLISEISKFTNKKCYSFYLNLENLHDQFINDIQASKADRFYILPFYPQYRPDISLIANFFSINLYEITDNFFWVKSFHNNQFFIKAIQKNIKTILKKNDLDEKDTIFLFLANEYKNCSLFTFECEITCQSIIKAFQYVEGFLCFCNENICDLLKNIATNPRKKILLIPITTLIDDNKTQKKLETIHKTLEDQNKIVFVCKTLNHNSHFIRSILDIIDEKSFVSNKMLATFN